MIKKILDAICFILIITAGLNWGLIGGFKYNLIENLFGSGPIIKSIYISFGLSALYTIYSCKYIPRK